MRQVFRRYREIILVTLILLVSILVYEFKFIIGNIYNRPDTVYLGTTHVANDYMYYLSQVVQGQNRWFCGQILQTTDYSGCTYVGWVNIFMGRVIYLLGLDSVWGYQLISLGWFGVLGVVGYGFIRMIEMSPMSQMSRMGLMNKRLLALMFFQFATAMPSLKLEGGSWKLEYFDYWYNVGNRMVRFVTIPHHMIGQSFLVLALIQVICYTRVNGLFKQSIVSFLLLLSGFVVASVNTIQWGMGVGICGLVILIGSWREFFPRFSSVPARNEDINDNKSASSLRSELNRRIPNSHHPKILLVITRLFPVICFFLGGLPMAIYLKSLLTTLPYSQMVQWEATTPLAHTPALLFFLGYGPVLVLALIGVFFMVRKLTPGRLMVMFFPVVSIGIFLSPLPGLLQTSGARFIPYITSLFLGVLASEGVFGIGGLRGLGNLRKPIQVLLVTGFFVLTIPTYIVQTKEILATNTGDAFIFLPRDAMEVFDYVKTNTGSTDRFLVNWPFHVILPALTGRQSYWGDYLMTVDSIRKENEARMFFYTPDADIGQKVELLKREKINYVVAYPWMPEVNSIPCLKMVKGNNFLGLYKVECR